MLVEEVVVQEVEVVLHHQHDWQLMRACMLVLGLPLQLQLSLLCSLQLLVLVAAVVQMHAVVSLPQAAQLLHPALLEPQLAPHCQAQLLAVQGLQLHRTPP